MFNHGLKLLILLVLALAISACQPDQAETPGPDVGLETAVQQIATAISESDSGQVVTPTGSPTEPALLFPEETQTSQENTRGTAAADVRDTPTPGSAEIPETGQVILPTATSAGGPAAPVATNTVTVAPAAPIATNTVTSAQATPTSTEQQPSVISPALQAGAPPEIDQAENEWPMANRDYNNSRAAVDAAIFSNNAETLGVAWSYDLSTAVSDDLPFSSPIIFNQVVYYQDAASNLYAVNLVTGGLVWQQLYNQPVVGPNGPAVGYGKLFAHVGENSLRALNLETGEEIWNVELEGTTGSHQPYVYGRYVLTATRAGDSGGGVLQTSDALGSGWIYAIDEESGQVAWRYAISGDDTSARGGSVWFPPAVDVERNLTFWGTGNLVSLPNELTPILTLTPEPNTGLYSSVLGLNLENGELVRENRFSALAWSWQGAEAAPVLVSQEGEISRDILISTGRFGRVVAIDRETGETLWDIQVGRHQNNQISQFPAGRTIQISPGIYGGVASPLAYADGTLYAVVNLHSSPFNADGATIPTQTPTADGQATPTPVTNGQAAPTPAAAGPDLLTAGRSEVIAIDVATGAVLWTTELSRLSFGGATVVNDLVFTSTVDGIIYAIQREDGDEVWAARAPEGLLSLPAVSGDTVVFASLQGNVPMLFALRTGLIRATPTPFIPGFTMTPTPTLAATQPVAPVTPTVTSTVVIPTAEQTPTDDQSPTPVVVTPTEQETAPVSTPVPTITTGP